MKSDQRTRFLASFIINSSVYLFTQQVLIEHLLYTSTFSALEIQQEMRQIRFLIL